DHMEALKRDPRSAATFNQLGWVWATCPDPDIRNGERARECATRACELTEWTEPGFLDTLAAACAECGEFDDAVKWQEKAVPPAAATRRPSRTSAGPSPSARTTPPRSTTGRPPTSITTSSSPPSPTTPRPSS